MPLRIIQIGFNLCGTRSLTVFFKNNNLKSLHWENGSLAKNIYYNLQNGRKLLHGFDATVYADMEWLVAPHFYFEPYKLFPLLYHQYPDAYFILNHRNRNEWINSRMKHFDGKYAESMMKTLKITSKEKLISHWENDWDTHLGRVRNFFSDKESNFFEFNLNTDGPEVLVENIAYKFTKIEFPHIKGKQGW